MLRTRTVDELRPALDTARRIEGPRVAIHIEVDRYAGIPGYNGSWDVPVAEVSDDPAVREAGAAYEEAHRARRQYLETP